MNVKSKRLQRVSYFYRGQAVMAQKKMIPLRMKKAIDEVVIARLFCGKKNDYTGSVSKSWKKNISKCVNVAQALTEWAAGVELLQLPGSARLRAFN